jgi:hypothetical protein
MPYDPIERWEWEGGGLGPLPNSSGNANSDESRSRPEGPTAQRRFELSAVERKDLETSAPPGASASTTSPTDTKERRGDRRLV